MFDSKESVSMLPRIHYHLRTFRTHMKLCSMWFMSKYVCISLPRRLSGKEFACNAGVWVRSLGWENTLEMEMATHSTVLAWRTSWTEETGGLQPGITKRARSDLVSKKQHVYKGICGKGQKKGNKGQ